MPFYETIHIRPQTQLHLWKIDEPLDYLIAGVLLQDYSLIRLHKLKSEVHQKGFLAVRHLLQHLGYADTDLTYDTSGKPHLSDGHHVSISHSYGFAAVAISDENLGLDIEAMRPKVLKIAPRFMDVDTHLTGLSLAEQLQKATIIWSIKEAVFKIKNEKGISYPNHISEQPFAPAEGTTVARLDFKHQTEFFPVHFIQREDYIFVCVFES
ncbi:4'-phosphopantetheinyl transferase family protein [Flavobacterium sp.]|jgi:4'-phosphopantetheinyl transferase|uniref:4'-phosphopantetheinyl transferase family protein n=1 Tax=Flavobacterium sp. TaxID=239 RepID=UPI0022BE6170|nr:4'-phosphopantetheinyl transferase superfamily protein [Flavobacterium sp.]MCZ8146040.1 4-phosphopantetheinyl transferase [Flavobacterium sp.]MCZ8366847.1 4-phosphopantetheinyl transferase [Flavobacterium sp.]